MGAAAAPVSEEQALEIIRRTDHVFTGSDFIRKQFPKEVISLDFLNEMLGVLLAFPYLNFIAAIIGEPAGAWPGIPPPLCFACPGEPFFLPGEPHIPERKRQKYMEYSALYGGPDPRVYFRNCSKEQHRVPADGAYLKKCIRAYGLEPENFLNIISKKRGEP